MKYKHMNNILINFWNKRSKQNKQTLFNQQMKICTTIKLNIMVFKQLQIINNNNIISKNKYNQLLLLQQINKQNNKLFKKNKE